MKFDSVTRRLPVYMLIDCSASMNGDAIESVDQGFKNLTARLLNDPHTADIVWLSIIVFDSVPRQLIPLCPIDSFRSLPLSVGGSSNLGKALDFLYQCVKKEVRKQTGERRGDWKPLVFLMTDGRATDHWEEVCRKHAGDMNMVACGVGSDANISNLKLISDKVVQMKDMSRETFDQFIEFLSFTMSTASQRTDSRSDRLILEQKYDRILLT
ncbi:MAG: VWA domain-containing protein [Desulfococcaceae bacterium]|jgi:uncharacterized protein YegL|nr:VWA domain-containing protein [Desulfococcaceae bacterium]